MPFSAKVDLSSFAALREILAFCERINMEPDMENKNGFAKILSFFQTRQTGVPGDPYYNTAFCHTLSEAASAEEASIWQLDHEGLLHLVFGISRVCLSHILNHFSLDKDLHQLYPNNTFQILLVNLLL